VEEELEEAVEGEAEGEEEELEVNPRAGRRPRAGEDNNKGEEETEAPPRKRPRTKVVRRYSAQGTGGSSLKRARHMQRQRATNQDQEGVLDVSLLSHAI
jgi:hypothetical protein